MLYDNKTHTESDIKRERVVYTVEIGSWVERQAMAI